MTDNTDPPSLALLNIDEVTELTRLSKASLYRRIHQKKFPEPLPLLPDRRRVAWRARDVQAWIDAPLEWGAEAEF